MKKRPPGERFEELDEMDEHLEEQEAEAPGHAAEGGPAAAVTIPVMEYEELREQAAEWKDRCLRAAADFENLRKRMEREREDIMCFANERLISELLPILDNLDRALSVSPSRESLGSIVEGVRMISRQLHGVLEQCGLEPLKTVGEPFDPNLHEAVGVLPSAQHDEGTVVAEVQKGYRLKGKVLRHSMVHVAAPRVDDDHGDGGK